MLAFCFSFDSRVHTETEREAEARHERGERRMWKIGIVRAVWVVGSNNKKKRAYLSFGSGGRVWVAWPAQQQ